MTSDPGHKPFRMKVKLVNNRLVRAREELGLNQAAAARAIKIGQNILSAFENLGRTDPAGRWVGKAWSDSKGCWSEQALKIAAFYGYSPEYLWPQEVEAVRRSAFQLEVSTTEAAILAGGESEMAAQELATNVRKMSLLLGPLHQRVLRERYENDKTLDEIGDIYGLSKERARRIIIEAERALRERLAVLEQENTASGLTPMQRRLISEKASR